MKRRCFLFATVCLSTMMLLVACNSKFPGYKMTADGLYYKFYSKNSTARQPKQSEYMKVAMACYLHDSLYYDFQSGKSEVYVQMDKSHFPADLLEAYSMMHVGDSASFYIKADSVALKYYNRDPKSVGLTPEDYFRYEVKLLKVESEEEFQTNVDKLKKSMMEDSHKALTRYISENNINVEPLESGIYLIVEEKGNGRSPVKGEKVEVDFSAALLNGWSVGSTYDSPEKFSFVLGEGLVIPAWEEIIPKMHLGDHVKAIVPFEMAYDENSVGNIPPYSNLIYDVKLLNIITVEEQRREAEIQRQAMREEAVKLFVEYLKTNNITDHTPSGLYYNKTLTTNGATPVHGQKVQIKFEASYIDGTKLGTSDDLGGFYEVEYGKGTVLRGLEEGIGLMRVGEKSRFVIPYTLAYGEQQYKNIPAFSNLVFDVELLKIE